MEEDQGWTGKKIPQRESWHIEWAKNEEAQHSGQTTREKQGGRKNKKFGTPIRLKKPGSPATQENSGQSPRKRGGVQRIPARQPEKKNEPKVPSSRPKRSGVSSEEKSGEQTTKKKHVMEPNFRLQRQGGGSPKRKNSGTSPREKKGPTVKKRGGARKGAISEHPPRKGGGADPRSQHSGTPTGKKGSCIQISAPYTREKRGSSAKTSPKKRHIRNSQ